MYYSPQPYDAVEEARAWDLYVSAAYQFNAVGIYHPIEESVKAADAMLAERRKRFSHNKGEKP